MTAFFGDRMGLKRAMLVGAGMTAIGYPTLPFLGDSLYASLGDLFIIFLSYEFAIVCSFSLGTELLPSARATMMAGYLAAAGVGRMVGAFAGDALWTSGGLAAVTTTSTVTMLLAMACLGWGLRGWTAADEKS